MTQNSPVTPAFDPRASIGEALRLGLGRHDPATPVRDLDLEALASDIAGALERDRQAHQSASPDRLLREGRQVEALNASNDV